MTTAEHISNKTKESYDSIVCGIKGVYNNSITDKEANEAARNLIGFCNIIVNYKIEQMRNNTDKTDAVMKDR